jgi:predicted ATP-dependent serine protease
MPGAGKSTLIQQMTVAYLKAMPVGEGMYIASEEALPALKERGDRLNVDVQDRIRLVDAMTGVADIGAILLSRKPIFIMIDSLNGIVGDDMAMSVELCRVLKKYSTVLQAPCIAVSHFNKDLDFAGLMALQHEVDALVTLDVDEGTGVRILEARKNRTGKTFVPVPFTMTEHGLVLFEEEERDLPA